MRIRAVSTYIITALLALGGNANADLKLTMEETTVMKIPGGETAPSETRSEYTLWIQNDRSARVSSDLRIIARLDLGETYMINDADKTVRTLKLGKLPDAFRNRPQIQKTAETRKIGQWDTIRYNLTFAMTPDDSATMTLWISDDVDLDLDTYRAFSRNADTGDGLLSAIAELPGYPVLQETDVGIAKTKVKLIAAVEAVAPTGTYDAPSNYQHK